MTVGGGAGASRNHDVRPRKSRTQLQQQAECNSQGALVCFASRLVWASSRWPRQGVRGIHFLLLVLSWPLASCRRDWGPRLEIDHVNVTITNFRREVRIGDTVSVLASGFTDQGHWIGPRTDVNWMISDPGIARLDPTDKPDHRIAHGLRAGATTIMATIEGKTGQAVLNVVP